MNRPPALLLAFGLPLLLDGGVLRSVSFAIMGEGAISVYTFMDVELWRSDPETAYGEWQRAEATGADSRTFAERSIVQHRSMFSRFHRYLTAMASR